MPRPKLKKRADGRYRCRLDGVYFYGSTSAEAYAKMDAYAMAKGQGLRHENRGVTVKDYAARWLDTYKQGVTDGTRRQYAAQLRGLCDSIGSVRLVDVTPSMVQAVYNERLAGRSKSSVHVFVMITRELFRAAAADRLILFNPADGVHGPKADAGTHRAILPWERALIHSVVHRLRPLVMVMLYCGLRRGEALFLDLSRDYDPNARALTVRGAFRFSGNELLPATTKTAAGLRVVPVPDVLAAELDGLAGPMADIVGVTSAESFRRAWESYLVALSVAHNGRPLRWAAGKGATAEEQKKARAAWARVCIRPHDLRHSCVTMWYNSGVDVLTCSRWAGHADIQTTLKIYTHLTAEKEAAEKMAMISRVNSALEGRLEGQTVLPSPETPVP